MKEMKSVEIGCLGAGPSCRSMLLAQRVSVAALIFFGLCSTAHGSKFTSCIKHCEVKETRNGRSKQAKDEAEKCRNKCLPYKDQWDKEHEQCYEACLLGKFIDSDSKRECSRICHRDAVSSHAKERYLSNFARGQDELRRKHAGLPSREDEKRMKWEASRPKISAEDIESLQACVAECNKVPDPYHPDARGCAADCQKTYLGDPNDELERLKESGEATDDPHNARLSGAHERWDKYKFFDDDDDDLWGLKHDHSGPGSDGGLEL